MHSYSAECKFLLGHPGRSLGVSSGVLATSNKGQVARASASLLVTKKTCHES